MLERNVITYGKILLLILLFLHLPFAFSLARAQTGPLPNGFVYVNELIPTAVIEMRYHEPNNFTDGPVPGYAANKAILSLEAATALKNVSDTCADLGYVLKIFDAYRPQSAVNYFISWSKQPENGATKAAFYPHTEKSQLFKLGYLATRSGHSRGGTVDLTLVELATGRELDMGTPFDFLDSRSGFNAQGLTNEQIFNRALLRNLMEKNGFKAYNKEWWHFTLINEPFPKTYFDFPVE